MSEKYKWNIHRKNITSEIYFKNNIAGKIESCVECGVDGGRRSGCDEAGLAMNVGGWVGSWLQGSYCFSLCVFEFSILKSFKNKRKDLKPLLWEIWFTQVYSSWIERTRRYQYVSLGIMGGQGLGLSPAKPWVRGWGQWAAEVTLLWNLSKCDLKAVSLRISHLLKIQIPGMHPD